MVEEQVKESSLLEEHLEGEGVESVEGGRFPQVSISKPNKDLSPRWGPAEHVTDVSGVAQMDRKQCWCYRCVQGTFQS